MSKGAANMSSPHVLLLGSAEHPDFTDSLAYLRATASLDGEPETPPELIVVAQARSGEIRQREIESIRRRYPLAGIVVLLGSWSEGETRTGRPWPGVLRLYWYQFPSWWRRQLKLHRARRCPDWARPDATRLDIGSPMAADASSLDTQSRPHGIIVLSTEYRETADALSDVLSRAGYATVWERAGRAAPFVCGATAGIWDGGQLNDCESAELTAFCRRLARDATPVIVLLDFPRQDRVKQARIAGAVTVLGKPWLNADLLATLGTVTEKHLAYAA
jgi:hypothetical protein